LQVIGPDLAILDRIGDDIRRVLAQVPGVTYTEAQLRLGEPVAQLQADEAAASRAGLRLTDLAGRVQSRYRRRRRRFRAGRALRSCPFA
jgi:Cu/Ag efflux pump CusA